MWCRCWEVSGGATLSVPTETHNDGKFPAFSHSVGCSAASFRRLSGSLKTESTGLVNISI